MILLKLLRMLLFYLDNNNNNNNNNQELFNRDVHVAKKKLSWLINKFSRLLIESAPSVPSVLAQPALGEGGGGGTSPFHRGARGGPSPVNFENLNAIWHILVKSGASYTRNGTQEMRNINFDVLCNHLV